MHTAQKRLLKALVEETVSQWRPQVRAQARERVATSGGLQVKVCAACCGFEAAGSSDDGLERFMTTAFPPIYAAEILRLQEAGAKEEDRHPVIADAITAS